LKISQNNAKLPQERPKNLTKYLVFEQPKMTFYFWTKQFGACKKKRKNNTKLRTDGTSVFGVLKTRLIPKNLAVFSKVNNQKRPKILQKALISMHPKSIQISIDHQKLDTPKMVKNHPKSSIPS
jgi:hypothetical protein